MFSFVLYYCFHICIVYLYCTVLTVYTTVTNTVSCIHSLSYPVKLIDARLGFFQKTFGLTGNQGEVWIYINLPDLCVSVRQLAVTLPDLVTWKGTPSKVKDNIFCLNEEMGFTREELRGMVVECPQLLKTYDRTVGGLIVSI